MSADITPAIQRASQALWEDLAPFMAADLEAMAVARRTLSVGFDLDEMTKVMADHPDIWPSASGWKCAGCGRLVPGRVRAELKAEATRLHQARSYRDALLGADS